MGRCLGESFLRNDGRGRMRHAGVPCEESPQSAENGPVQQCDRLETAHSMPAPAKGDQGGSAGRWCTAAEDLTSAPFTG
jgi:hypothetical protein